MNAKHPCMMKLRYGKAATESKAHQPILVIAEPFVWHTEKYGSE